MSDAKLRELLRELQTRPTRRTEAAYLREGLRTGALTREQVELCAALGQPSANDVCPRRIELPAGPRGSLDYSRAVLACLPLVPQEASLRAALAVAWAVVHLFGRETERVQRALTQAERCLLTRSDELAGEIRDQLREEIELVEDDRCGSVLSLANALALAVRIHVVDGYEIEREWWGFGEDHVYGSFKERLLTDLESLAVDLDTLIGVSLPQFDRMAEPTRSSLRAETLGNLEILTIDADARDRPCTSVDGAAVAGARAELVPWLLGYCDPLRDRVQRG